MQSSTDTDLKNLPDISKAKEFDFYTIKFPQEDFVEMIS